MPANVTQATRPRLGDCLKALRRRKGLTLRQVSNMTGLAVSTLSKVENHQMSLTYDKLLQISSGLSVEVAALFQVEEPSTEAVGVRICRAGEGGHTASTLYDHLYQFADCAGKRLTPIMARIHARTPAEFAGLFSHAGEEYFLVLRGRVAVHTEDRQPVVLEEGDSLYLDSRIGHVYVNAGEGEAQGICICTGPDRAGVECP